MNYRLYIFVLFPVLLLLFFGIFTTLQTVPVFAATVGQQTHAHLPHFLRRNPGKHRDYNPDGSNLVYNGGPVIMGTMHIYAIFWEPKNNVAPGYNNLILRYFHDVDNTALYHLNAQYKQYNGAFPVKSQFSGSWIDRRAYPESPLLDNDIQQEVTWAQRVNGWRSSLSNAFFVYTGRDEDICLDNFQLRCASNTFCAYHNFFGKNTLYATLPYSESFTCNPGSSPNNNDADQTLNVTSHEQMEMATDPILTAWYDNQGEENGDKCAWTFAPLNKKGGDVTWNGHSYILQEEWDNRISGCNISYDLKKPGTRVLMPQQSLRRN